MPLEDLIGSSKYISDLNASWPDGDQDYLDRADDHMRGIKNVLQNTFPNVTGPVTRSNTDINTGAVPAGSSLPFYGAAAAPTGWARVAINNSYMMRVVPDDEDSTGGGHGSDDPILNNKVPAHIHSVDGTTGSNDIWHSHVLAMNAVPDHHHTFTRSNAQTGFAGGGAYNWNSDVSTVNTGDAGGHTPSGTVQGTSIPHTHVFSATTSANSSASNWTPRYINMMMCVKQ